MLIQQNFYTKQAVNILFFKTFFSNSIKLALQLYTKQMNINIVVVGISLLPVVKMNNSCGWHIFITCSQDEY